jgi:hypothetical protein
MRAVGRLPRRISGSSAGEFQFSEMYLDTSTPPTKWKQIWMMFTWGKQQQQEEAQPASQPVQG